MGLSAAAAAVLALCLGAPRAVAHVVGVQLVGERVFPWPPTGHDTLDDTLAQLGGLTALAYGHSTDRWFAASGADQRLYKFSLDLSIDTLFNVRNGRRCQACVSWPVELDIRAHSSRFPPRLAPRQAISLTPTWLPGFEQLVRIARPGLQTGGLAYCSDTGELLVAEQTPPSVLRVDGGTGAVLTNASLGVDATITRAGGELQSLSCARGGTLFAAARRLAADGDGPGVRIVSSKLVATESSTGASQRTTRYDLEAIEGNELVDVQALSTKLSPESQTDAVLTMETAGTLADGYAVQLFEVDLDTRRNVSGCDSFSDGDCSTAADAVQKLPVVDLSSLGRCSRPVNGITEQQCTSSWQPGVWTPLQVDNFRAMAIGPTIADGRRTLLLVNTDNHTAQGRGTHFILLALTEEHPRGQLNLAGEGADDLITIIVVMILFVGSAFMARVHQDRKSAIDDNPAEESEQQEGYSTKGTKFANPEAIYEDTTDQIRDSEGALRSVPRDTKVEL